MKPIFLHMKGFGSYRDEIVDFSNIDHGIFLITGDTGAGKTTIFDAITYALYDKSSGGKRNDKMMISQYSKPNEETEVELVFKIKNDEYKIVRRPEQVKYKEEIKDGQKVFVANKTPQASSVVLTINGEVYAGKKKETDEKIKSIMGIDENQFTQIAMLAQGDFVKLLHADSKSRKEIFEHIFDTRLYWLIANEFKEKNEGLEEQLKSNEEFITERLKEINSSITDELQERWENEGYFSEIENSEEELFELIKCLDDAYTEKLKEVDEMITAEENKRTELAKKLDQAEKINADFDKLDRLVDKRNELDKEAGEYELNKSVHLAAQRALRVETSHEIYRRTGTELVNAKQAMDDHQVTLAKAKDDYESAKADKEAKEAGLVSQLEEISAKKTIDESLLDRYDELDKTIVELKNIEGQLAEISQKIAEEQMASASIEKLGRDNEKLAEDIEGFKKDYEEKYHMFISNQAAFLRATLEEGKPCPVCGSVHHEVVAYDDETYVSKEEVDAAKDLYEEKANKLRKSEKDYNEKVNALNELRSSNKAEKVRLDTVFLEKQANRDNLKKTLAYANKQAAIRAIEGYAKQLDVVKKSIDMLQKNLDSKKTTFDGLSARSDLIKGQYETAGKNSAEAKLAFEESLRANGFESEDAYLAARRSDDQVKALEQKIKAHEEAVKECDISIKNYTEITKDKIRIDTSELLAKKAEIESHKSALDKEKLTLSQELSKNRSSETVIRQRYAKRRELVAEYLLINDIYETVCGKKPRKKINFQTYIQRRYFKRVIEAANVRLDKMSNHEFRLKCRDMNDLAARGEVGLDLDVYCPLTDTSRDVKTLSGGESFMAALSMALGLSDVIQNSAGRIHVDTMFIDEGFGSLSDETRNQALNLLNELSEGNRLIGIISHVSELKSQVDTKLLVTKNDKGSHVAWQY